jgi:hypothetical protein
MDAVKSALLICGGKGLIYLWSNNVREVDQENMDAWGRAGSQSVV